MSDDNAQRQQLPGAFLTLLDEYDEQPQRAEVIAEKAGGLIEVGLGLGLLSEHLTLQEQARNFARGDAGQLFDSPPGTRLENGRRIMSRVARLFVLVVRGLMNKAGDDPGDFGPGPPFNERYFHEGLPLLAELIGAAAEPSAPNDDQPNPDKHHLAIIKHLIERGATIEMAAIADAKSVNLSPDTVSKRVSDMEGWGWAHRPHGRRRGVAVTDKGRRDAPSYFPA